MKKIFFGKVRSNWKKQKSDCCVCFTVKFDWRDRLPLYIWYTSGTVAHYGKKLKQNKFTDLVTSPSLISFHLPCHLGKWTFSRFYLKVCFFFSKMTVLIFSLVITKSNIEAVGKRFSHPSLPYPSFQGRVGFGRGCLENTVHKSGKDSCLIDNSTLIFLKLKKGRS